MTHHVIIPCQELLHEQAESFLNEVSKGNASQQGKELAVIASAFYERVINYYTGEQFKRANVNQAITQTAMKLFSATSNQLINFFIPKLKESDIISLSRYVEERMLIVDGTTYVGWPAPDNAYDVLSDLTERTQLETFTDADVEDARRTYLEYQVEASKYLNDILFQPGELISVGPINRRLIAAGKKATRNGAITAVRRAVNSGSKEHLEVILDFQLTHLAKI